MKNNLFTFLFLIFLTPTFAQNDSLVSKNLTQFILVRHAEKMDNSKNPELSDLGKNRALKLNELLLDIKVDRLFATPYLRTQNTLKPIANQCNLEIESYNPNDTDFESSLLKENINKTVVVCGHSNTIPMMANKLIGEEKFKQLKENEYGIIWIIPFLRF